MATDHVAHSELVKLVEDARQLFLSPKEVTARLRDIASSLFAQRIRLEIEQFGQRYVWGADQSCLRVLQRGRISADVEFKVLGDHYPETAEEQKVLPVLSSLAEALWGEDMRPAGGLSWKRESVRVRLPQSVERLREQSSDGGSIAILFADLDEFKNLNDQAGHDKGDEAIRLINRELHDLCLRFGGLPFHPSGDEFYLILPHVGLLPMMDALYELRQRVQTVSFESKGGGSLTIDMTLGLQFLRETVTFDKVQQAITAAEDATKAPTKPELKTGKPEVTRKEKRRGKLSLAGFARNSAGTMTPQDFGRLGALIVRRRSCLMRPTFSDPRLGMVELVVEKLGVGSLDGLGERVERVRTWLDIETTALCVAASLLQQEPPHDLPRIALALAVASGLLRSAYMASRDLPGDLVVAFTSDGAKAQVRLNGQVVWGDTIDAGDDVQLAEIVTSTLGQERRALIGVQVGLSDRPTFSCGTELPPDLLSHVVVVDDRPNSGGGLPDLWQVAVAQVCRAGATSDRVSVFAWGRTSAGSETVRRLRGEVTWSVDDIAPLADIGSQVVRDVIPLLEQNLHLVTRATELVDSLYDLAPVDLIEESPESKTAATADVLHRERLDSQPLKPIDGLRCKTATQAYPIVIDVLRKETARESADDAWQSMRELIAFKLVLESPQQDPVPAYLRGQRNDLERYAEEVLLKPEGRIRGALEQNGQVDAFRRELGLCYSAGPEARSTRRAVLVVPHVPKDGAPSPEGLVSAWASPRVREGGGNIVDWVFVWRTVEAFIGLPYSLFGSIQLAQSLLAEVNLKLPGDTGQLRFGELTYIALSLHMRVDGVHRRIAKRIVDLSSD